MPGIDDRIADLEKRLKQAKALKQQQVARERAAEKRRQRSGDTRRKILVGAVVLAKVERGEWPKEGLYAKTAEISERHWTVCSLLMD
jgi:predicted Zn-dependent protease